MQVPPALRRSLSSAVAALVLAVSLPVPDFAQTPSPRVRRQADAPSQPPADSQTLEESQAPADEAAPEQAPEQAPDAEPEPARDAEPPATPEPQTTVAPIAPRSGIADGGLARRVRLGLTFAETADGMTVRAVAPRSAAASAGIREGDVVTMINAAPVRDADALLNRLRFIHPGEPVRIAVRRGSDSVDVQLVPDEAIREGDLEAKVEYGAFACARGKLRSVWSFPAKGLSTPRPAVLIIRGVGASASDAPGNNTFRDVSFQLARSGVIAVRYDPQGIGDSEGLPNPSVDFETEVADAKAALAHLREDPRVDPERVLLLGQGTGGGVAAVLASSEKVAGLVVIGMIARPLMEYLLDSRRQQMVLAGVPPGEIDDILREHVAIYANLIGNGRVPRSDPYGIVGSDGTLMGKGADFWRQYDKVNFGKLFSDLRVPVLNAIGEYDFVSTLGDHRAIADALKARGQEGQVLALLDHSDHDLRSFDSREAAFGAFGTTEAPVNERAVATIVEWVDARVRPAGNTQ